MIGDRRAQTTPSSVVFDYRGRPSLLDVPVVLYGDTVHYDTWRLDGEEDVGPLACLGTRARRR
jgi:hypothetical protein